jgi:hypothetical protein
MYSPRFMYKARHAAPTGPRRFTRSFLAALAAVFLMFSGSVLVPTSGAGAAPKPTPVYTLSIAPGSGVYLGGIVRWQADPATFPKNMKPTVWWTCYTATLPPNQAGSTAPRYFDGKGWRVSTGFQDVTDPVALGGSLSDWAVNDTMSARCEARLGDISYHPIHYVVTWLSPTIWFDAGPDLDDVYQYNPDGTGTVTPASTTTTVPA